MHVGMRICWMLYVGLNKFRWIAVVSEYFINHFALVCAMVKKVLAQGAEATVYKDADILIKERRIKSYRLPELDETLRSSRTKREAKVLTKLHAAGLRVPAVFSRDDATLTMEYIDGKRLSECLTAQRRMLCKSVGELLGGMHALGVIHGDPTTSNFIWQSRKGVWAIDFGLSYFSHKVEDMAVDIHLFRQALQSRHHAYYERAYAAFLQGYAHAQRDLVLARLETVTQRGRNKMKDKVKK